MDYPMKNRKRSTAALVFDAYLFSQPNNSFFGNLLLEINGKSRKIGNFNLISGVDFDLAKVCLTTGAVGIKLDRVQQLPASIAESTPVSRKKVSRGKEVQANRQVQSSPGKKVFRKSRWVK